MNFFRKRLANPALCTYIVPIRKGGEGPRLTTKKTETMNHLSTTKTQKILDILRIETLETRKSDSLDFHDLAVWTIEAALIEAGATKDQAAILAKKHLGLETLEARKSDSLDFHYIAVWALKEALLEAAQ